MKLQTLQSWKFIIFDHIAYMLPLTTHVLSVMSYLPSMLINLSMRFQVMRWFSLMMLMPTINESFCGRYVPKPTFTTPFGIFAWSGMLSSICIVDANFHRCRNDNLYTLSLYIHACCDAKFLANPIDSERKKEKEKENDFIKVPLNWKLQNPCRMHGNSLES